MNHKRPRSVLVLVHSPDRQILLLERSRFPGFWQSVTGSQEGRERPIDTAVRELEEETGIRAAASELCDWRLSHRFAIYPQWRHRYAPGVTHNVEHLLSIRVPVDTPVRLAPDEHRAWRWLPWRQAAREVFSWSNRAAILMLVQRPSVCPYGG